MTTKRKSNHIGEKLEKTAKRPKLHGNRSDISSRKKTTSNHAVNKVGNKKQEIGSKAKVHTPSNARTRTKPTKRYNDQALTSSRQKNKTQIKDSGEKSKKTNRVPKKGKLVNVPEAEETCKIRHAVEELDDAIFPSGCIVERGYYESLNKYIDAYWNLPSLRHRDEILPCYFRACIFDGYRDHWSWHETVVSLFSMHNETMCIWSHLIPFVVSAGAAVWLLIRMEWDGSTIIEQAMMGIFICTASICLFLSSIYHWYGCMSERHYYCLLSFDLGGIACLIAGSFFPGVYYGFYCTPLLQKIYLGVTCLIFVIGLVVSVYGSTQSANAALIRQGGFASLTIFGFVPLCHWMLIAPHEYREDMILGALGMFFFYGLGFSFLLTSFPESVWTNNYITTYLVPSHALWHLGVAAAIFTWLYTLLGAQRMFREKGCEAFFEYIDEFHMQSYAL